MPSCKCTFHLNSLECTRALAHSLAAVLCESAAPQYAPLPVLLLMGDLGAGKTTFIRFLTEALPGGENSEVASPSFTLCNVYPTTPQVQHFDLYRLPPGGSDEMLEESLEEMRGLILIEWAEYLPARVFPVDRIEMYWHGENEQRQVVLSGQGSGLTLLARLRERFARHSD